MSTEEASTTEPDEAERRSLGEALAAPATDSIPVGALVREARDKVAATLGEALAGPACVFCKRIERGEYDDEPRRGCYVFPPLNPVTPGHLLVVPGEHVRDAAVAPATAGAVMQQAALIVQRAGGNANIITSIGPAATQTVMHLHVHVVPRRLGDGLALPWTGQP